jgi:hypothetical protein
MKWKKKYNTSFTFFITAYRRHTPTFGHFEIWLVRKDLALVCALIEMNGNSLLCISIQLLKKILTLCGTTQQLFIKKSKKKVIVYRKSIKNRLLCIDEMFENRPLFMCVFMVGKEKRLRKILLLWMIIVMIVYMIFLWIGDMCGFRVVMCNTRFGGIVGGWFCMNGWNRRELP